jgi:hypothetical protein
MLAMVASIHVLFGRKSNCKYVLDNLESNGTSNVRVCPPMYPYLYKIKELVNDCDQIMDDFYLFD